MVVNWSNWGESKPGSRLTGWPKPSLARNWSTCGCAGGKALFIFKSQNFISLQLNLCVLEFIFNPTVYTSGHTFNNHYLLFSDHIQQYRSCILIICCAYLLLALLLYLVYHEEASLSSSYRKYHAWRKKFEVRDCDVALPLLMAYDAWNLTSV